jgi:hypothetical protein
MPTTEPADQAAASTPGRQARQLDAALRGLAQIREHVLEMGERDWADVGRIVDDVIAEVNEIADGRRMAIRPQPEFPAYRVGDRVRVIGTVVGVNDSDDDWVNVQAFGAVFTVEPSGHPDLSPAAAQQPQPAPGPDALALVRLAAGWERQAFAATDRSFAAGVHHAAETLRLLLDGDEKPKPAPEADTPTT